MNMQLMMARARMNHHAPPSGGGDPYWANVISLLHFDSAVSASVANDVTGRVWATTGAVTLDSAVKKFGASSAKFTGTSYLRSAGGAGVDLGTGDFTIEAWTYCTMPAPASAYMFDVGSNGITAGPNSNAAGRWVGYTGSIGATLYNAGPARDLNAWHHVAVERVAGVVTGYMDGVAWGTSATSPNSAGVATTIGAYGGSSISWGGNIAEFRITRGVARYKGDFAVPTAAFPNHA